MKSCSIAWEICKRVSRTSSVTLQHTVPFVFGLMIGYFIYVFLFYRSIFEGDSPIPVKMFKFVPSVPGTNDVGGDGSNSESGNSWNQQKVRLLCIVMTTPTHHRKRAIPISNTWGKRCDGIYFMTSAKDKKLNNTVVLDVLDHSFNVWRKTKAAWKYVHDSHLDEYDWFLKVDDDIYIVIENLRSMLRAKNHSQPAYFGHLLRHDDFTYLSGYPGYVMSKEAVKRFVGSISDSETILGPCSGLSFSTEEVLLGKCLESAGVSAVDTRDSQGRLRFLPLPLQYHFAVTRYRRKVVREMIDASDKGFHLGIRCCSDVAIAFHEMDGKKMLSMEYIIYHLSAYGIREMVQSEPGIQINYNSTAPPLSDPNE